MQLPYCAALDGQFLQVRDSQIWCDYCFFVLVAYPVQWTGASGREALVLGCNCH